MLPGKPYFFATAMTLGGIATGLLAKSFRRPSDQGRGKSGPSGQPRCDRRTRAGLVAGYVRSRPLAGDHVSRSPTTWQNFI